MRETYEGIERAEAVGEKAGDEREGTYTGRDIPEGEEEENIQQGSPTYICQRAGIFPDRHLGGRTFKLNEIKITFWPKNIVVSCLLFKYLNFITKL